MIAYKLFRVRKDGTIGSLFINKKAKLPIGEKLEAHCFPTSGFKVRPGWHCCPKPYAPHLSPKGREWYEVEMRGNVISELRPESQGGKWFLAEGITILRRYG